LLYDAQPGTEAHAGLEAEYNELRRQRLKQSPEEYVYKHDVRHEFEFLKVPDEQGRIIGTIARNAKLNPADVHDDRRYSLRNPEEVINWRNTEVGEELDQKARSISKKTGDDAGHHIALQFGTEPAEPDNISNQNWIQNQSIGTYFDFESRAADYARRGYRVGLEVETCVAPDSVRPIGRIVTTFERDAEGRPVPDTDRSIIFLNTTTQEVRLHQEGSYEKGDAKASRAADRIQEKQTQASMDAAEETFRGWSPEDKRAWIRENHISGGKDWTPEGIKSWREKRRKRK
jgi:DNA/RNA non-specific endonuclease